MRLELSHRNAYPILTTHLDLCPKKIMEAYEEFLRWAGDRGVELDGVEPRAIPGRGMGIAATRPLKVSETNIRSSITNTPTN